MIQELKAIVGTEASFARANGFSRDDIDDGIVNEIRLGMVTEAMAQGLVPKYGLKVTTEVCAWAAELDGIDRIEECEATLHARACFCARAGDVFFEALDVSDVEFELSSFTYNKGDESADGRVTYTIELDAEELLAIHDRSPHADAVAIESLDDLIFG